MIGKTQGYYPKLKDFKRMMEQDYAGIGKTHAKSLQFWATVFDFSIMVQDSYLENIKTIEALYKQTLKIPVWKFISEHYGEKEFNEEHLMEELQKNFPDASKSALGRDVKALLKMHSDDSLENPFYEIIFAKKNNLAKRHFLQAGFARVYKGDERLSKNEISDYFDKLYARCPNINNEYLTKDKPSSVGTRAIRNLVKYFIQSSELKSDSVEKVMLDELFRNDEKISNICDEIEIFLHKAESKINLEKLYGKLSLPPYGLTKPIISLLFLDILLKQGDKVSIFEKSQFQLEITELLYERLMANPQNFEVQKNVFNGERKLYLEKFSKIICSEGTDNLLEVTKSLVCKIKELDKYTKYTDSLCGTTLKFRNAILNAKEPYKLIFNDIPRAFDNESFLDFDFEFLGKCAKELDNSYFNLIQELLEILFDAFDLKIIQRKELAYKFEQIEDLISDDNLKIIATNIKEDQMPNCKWITRIATVVNKKNVPKNWSDYDVADFKQKIKEIALKVKALEVISSNKITITVDKKITDFVKSLTKIEKLTLLREVLNG